jgi:hypothetical protein
VRLKFQSNALEITQYGSKISWKPQKLG